MAKPSLPVMVTPIGQAAYAWLSKPDSKFAKGDKAAQYKITVVVEDNADNRAWVEAFVQKGKDHCEALKDDPKNKIKLKKNFAMPFVQLPEDDDEDEVKEEFKGKIRIIGKSNYKPKCFDTKKNELPEDVWVMSGDIVRAMLQVSPYEGLGSGITGKLAMVQLIEKRASMGGADVNDFDDVDGFVADKDAFDQTTDEEDESSDAADY